MEYALVEKRYQKYGITDYRLKSIDDLLNIYRINISKITGYNELTDENRLIFDKFIVNLFNGMGLNSRTSLKPKAVYWAEEINFSYKENPSDDYYIPHSLIVSSISRDNKKQVKRRWHDPDITKDIIPEKENPVYYLRFEYEHNKNKEWLHIINDGNEWY